MKQQARLALGVSLCLGLPVASFATIWTVSETGALTTIQEAIDRASPGDAVLVMPGTYHERLVLRDGVSVTAQTPFTVTVEAEAEGSAVTAIGIGSSTLISGIVFLHGSALNGGGLHGVATNATFSDCAFMSCGAVLGGGAYLGDGSRASFIRCSFRDNESSVGGGVYLDFSAISISASAVNNNRASDGAALAAVNGAEALISYTSIYDNEATAGACISCNDSSPRFTNCTVATNIGSLGAFALRGSGSRIERCIVAFNFGPAIGCAGSNSPWIGCNVLYGNTSQVVCQGDHGDNIYQDPRFCDPSLEDFGLAANSPAAGGSCGLIGAQTVACPASGIETSVTLSSWGRVKSRFR